MIYSSSDLLLISDILDMQIALNTSINGSSYVFILIFINDLPIFLESQTCKKMGQNEEIKV